MKKLLLFDIDGTLLRAKDATRNALSRAFYDVFGIEKSIVDINFLGRTDPELFQEASCVITGHRLNDGEYSNLVDHYLEFLPGELERCEFWLMPGVEALLEDLSLRENVVLGLETGNIEPAAFLKLGRGSIGHYFSFGGFGSDNEDRTELVRIAIERVRNLNGAVITNENVFIIGDSSHDIIAGRDLGINTLAVCTGLAEPDTLLAESPSRLLEDLSDTQHFLQCVGL